MTDLVDDNSNNPAPAGAVTPVVAPTIDTPITMTPVSAGDISTPNTLNRVASQDIGVPNDIGAIAGGSISTPNALARVSGGNISTPNTLTRVTAGDISAPNTLNRIAAGSVATPNTLAPVAAQHINRVLKPIISFDFGNQIYSKDGQPQTFAGITTFSRASTATYVETYIDNLSRKQKRIATAAVNTPRFEEKGLLVEGASTNVAFRSEEFNLTPWVALEASVSSNVALAPDKTFSADKLIDTTTLQVHQISQNATLFDGAIYTYSIYAKAAELSQLSITITRKDGVLRTGVFDLSLGIVISSTATGSNIEKISDDGWYRCSISENVLSGASAPLFRYQLSKDGVPSFAGTGTSGIFIWGAQLEALPFATSYIRTEGSAVSRAGDNASADIKQLETQGSILIESSYLGSTANIASNRVSLSLTNGGSTERIRLYNGASDQDSALYTSGGTTLALLSDGIVRDDQELRTSVLTFKGGEQKLYKDKINVASSSVSRVPLGLFKVNIGSSNSGVIAIYGHVKRAEVYDTALTPNEVKAL